MVGQIVICCGEPEAARFLEHEFLLNQFFDQVTPEVKTLGHLPRQRALEDLTIALDGALILKGELALADDLAVDFGDFRGRWIAILTAAIECDKYDDND